MSRLDRTTLQEVALAVERQFQLLGELQAVLVLLFLAEEDAHQGCGLDDIAPPLQSFTLAAAFPLLRSQRLPLLVLVLPESASE